MVFSKYGTVAYSRAAHVYEKNIDKAYKYIYYTEADQIVRFASMDALYGISSATNQTTFLLPRRKEKEVPSVSKDYDNSLSEGRFCGCTVCGCSFEYNELGKQLSFRPREHTDQVAAPDMNHIRCLMKTTPATPKKDIPVPRGNSTG